MAGETPHPVTRTTGRRANFKKTTPHILQQPHRHCDACGTPLYIREFRYCRPCRAHIAFYRALVELSRIAGGMA